MTITEQHPAETRQRPSRVRRAGLSLIEMLVALAISAMLLTATAVAIDTSFTAYAIAAESASTQTSTRMVVNRLLTLVRTSTAHGPMPLDAGTGFTVSDDIVTSDYLILQEADGDFITITWDSATQQLSLTQDPGTGTITTQPILGGVTACEFTLRCRRDNSGTWVLERASIDFTVEADDDASLDIEVANIPSVRVIASTKPRRVAD
ncbi:MAG: prepilin-type N-terminal cleavage/methylation domain-containing protein [Planctomycetota bacterium]